MQIYRNVLINWSDHRVWIVLPSTVLPTEALAKVGQPPTVYVVAGEKESQEW